MAGDPTPYGVYSALCAEYLARVHVSTEEELSVIRNKLEIAHKSLVEYEGEPFFGFPLRNAARTK